MEKERKTSTDFMKENNLSQTPNESIINHIKAEYLYLVSQTSSSLAKKTNNTENQFNIQSKNDKASLIAADLALQYLQSRNMSLTLGSASSESQNLLSRHFEDRWLAREVQIRGKRDVLHGLILSKKNNEFDIGFGSNFMKKKREEEDKKYRSNTLRSKSLPAGNNLMEILNEPDENDQDKAIDEINEDQQNIEKQINDSDNRSRSNRSKSSKSSKTKKPRKSYQGPKTKQIIPVNDEISFQRSSPKINYSESQTDSQKINQVQPQTNQSTKSYNKDEIENIIDTDSQENTYNHRSQSQKTSNGSGSNNINDNTINSNILPSPLKTTYSGREDIDENISNDFGYDDEIKTHTYQYSTIYSDEEATHITEYEYETIEQLSESNDYNSKTHEYLNDKDIPPQKSNRSENRNSKSNENDKYSINTSPNINNYTGTTYEYYSYSTINENEYSNYQDQQLNLKNPAPPKKKQEDLQLQFPFVQSRDVNISSGEDNQQQQQSNRESQQKKHHDYYYHKHSKKDKQLGISAPVVLTNLPEDLSEEPTEADNNQNNSNIIEEEEKVEPEEDNQNEEKVSFFIFHAVDIEPDLELQRLFKIKAKETKGKFTSSVLENSSSKKKSPGKQTPSPPNKNKSLKKSKFEEREVKLDSLPNENSKSNPSFSGLFDYINSASENQKIKKLKKPNKRTENDGKSSPTNNNNNYQSKNYNRNQTHKHGSIKRGSQIIDSINSKLSGISNINNDDHENSTGLYSGVSSLVIAPSSTAASKFSSSNNKQKQYRSNGYNANNDQISIEKNRKTKFSNKLKSSKIENTKKQNKHSPPLKKNKNSSTSFGSTVADIEISDSSTNELSIDKICEAISEDELLEMSDAPSVSFD